ncbi:MAG TPA: hypothetical protein VHC86_07455 [Opitutaceae bacterium]|nr:hypothetical protein [Opitutaceae bacterium]
MFPNLLRLITRKPPASYDRSFVEEVRVPRERRRRNPKIDRLFAVGWILVALKTAFVIWAVPRYHIPFSAMWVVIPTLIFAALCTALYYWRR